eukprot:16178333-Heterocapsa_arctica.AAC.1
MINIEKSQYPKTERTRFKLYTVLKPFRVLFVELAACPSNSACYLSYSRPVRPIPRAVCRTRGLSVKSRVLFVALAAFPYNPLTC